LLEEDEDQVQAVKFGVWFLNMHANIQSDGQTDVFVTIFLFATRQRNNNECTSRDLVT